MHAECSPTSVQQRYLSPMPVLGARLAARLLCPPGGFALVAERENELVGIATVAPFDDEPVAEAGLLVVDRCQRQGVGTALLAACTREAARLGFTRLVLMAHPDNRAVLSTVNAVGLRARVSTSSGLTSVVMTLPSTGGRPRLHSTGASANN
jgi:GNAT superfamily N-acetyltransferase